MKNAKGTTPKAAGGPAKPVAPSRGLQRWGPWVVTIFFGLWLVGNLRPARDKSEFNLTEFGKLPVVLEGRVQPIDSMARNTLLLMRSKQTLAIEPEGSMMDLVRMFKTKRMPAVEWLLELVSRPDDADKRKLFRLDHPELKSLLKLPIEEKHFSLDDIRPGGPELGKEAQRISRVEVEVRTPFEKSVVRLATALTAYGRLKSSIQPEDAENFAEEVALFDRGIAAGLDALKKSQAGEEYSEEDLGLLARAFRRFENQEQVAYPSSVSSLPLLIPPLDPSNKDGWTNVPASLKESMRTGTVHPAAKAYTRAVTAYQKNKPEDFNAAVSDYKAFLKGRFDGQLAKGRNESFFNHFAPFIKALTVYLVSFLFACAYWFRWSPWLRVSAVWLAALGFVVHTLGLIFRMYLEGRPPVTNLYSSAIFVGWGSVILGLILERIYKDGIGVVTASFIGFGTMVIAHNLSLDGDTMKLLQAVLDTNIWLATHVVIITLGYASMFLAGFLAIVYVLRGIFTSTLPPATGKSLARMVYGITCFSTLFSFVGTVLGGIWADQSWGRFWGWDPKENGALMIVIWCAVMLHARWGGLVRERGLMAMAIFGNVITAFSWFGVNMLGVGLHSYGFMDEAFKWLVGFITLQMVLIGLAMLPASMWKSPPGGGAAASGAPPKKNEPEDSEQLAAAQKMLPENPS